MSARGAGRAILGIAISIAAILLVLGSVDLPVAIEVLRAASPSWIALVVVFICLDLLIRAVRWRRLLAPIRDVGFGRVLSYLLIGYLANNLLPARLGELVRSHYIGDREGLSRTTALGTVVVERLVDTAVVVAIAAVGVLVLRVRGIVTSAVLIGAAIVALLSVLVAIGIVAHRLPGAGAVSRWIGQWPRVAQAIRRLRGGLAVASNPRTLFDALFLSVLAWGATVLSFAAGGHAVGMDLRISEAALLASGVALASAIPSGPGYLGTYELAAVTIARALGLNGDTAFALAVLVHAAILLITSGGGLIAVARVGWRGPGAAPGSGARGPASP